MGLMKGLIPKNASFDLKLDMFSDDNRCLSLEEKKERSFAACLKNGVHVKKEVSSILEEVLGAYHLVGNVLELQHPHCERCGCVLRKKEAIEKAFPLPGGNALLLSFQGYFCERCSQNVRLRLPGLFKHGDRYPSYVKGESVRLYESHLSSYDGILDELKNLFGMGVSKRSARKWVREAGVQAEEVPISSEQFSGYFAYDEEFVKVFEGRVGVRGAKLRRIEVYVLLLRDVITKSAILSIGLHLDEQTIEGFLSSACKQLCKASIPIYSIVTDGKREYKPVIDRVSRTLIQEKLLTAPIAHALCVFHFKNNLYEAANEYYFGTKHSREQLPDHLQNQIKEFDKVLDALTIEDAQTALSQLVYEKNTFISPLQKQIYRLTKNKEEYLYQIQHQQVRTTDAAENFFSITKPDKIKKAYKTTWGLNGVLQTLRLKKATTSWLSQIGFRFNFKDAITLLVTATHADCI